MNQALVLHLVVTSLHWNVLVQLMDLGMVMLTELHHYKLSLTGMNQALVLHLVVTSLHWNVLVQLMDLGMVMLTELHHYK